MRQAHDDKTAGTGVFLDCSGYSLPPKSAVEHRNLTAGVRYSIEEDDEAESDHCFTSTDVNCVILRWIVIS